MPVEALRVNVYIRLNVIELGASVVKQMVILKSHLKFIRRIGITAKK